MVKRILLIRHGQGDHNKLFAQNKIAEALALRDPPINSAGVEQAQDLNSQLLELLAKEFPLQLIISSPMRRALMTTEQAFNRSTCPLLISPLPSEMGDGGCDYGSPRSLLETEFPHHDFSLLEEEWWPVEETMTQMGERVDRFKAYLNSRPETHIAVVSHGRFLTKFIDVDEFCAFGNCDCREVVLEEDGRISDSGIISLKVDYLLGKVEKE